MTPPLSGIRVVEFGHYIAVPAASQILADLGADVIKIEGLTGDQSRTVGSCYGDGIIRAFNRGKRSVALDLKDPAGLAAAMTLIETADVVVQNMRAGAMAKLGLGAKELRTRFPQLVHVSVAGFSSLSPSADRAGLDIAAQAESGLMSITGEAASEPQRVGFPVIDAAASYSVVQAVMTGLFQRERQGKGATVEISLLDVAIHMQSAVWGEWHASGVEPYRKGNGQATGAPAADVVKTRDGSIVLSAYTALHFATLCRLMDKPWMTSDPRFVDNAARVIHRAELLGEIEASFGLLSMAECVELLSKNGLVAAAVRTYTEVRDSPDVVASGVLTTGIGPDGIPFTVPGLPFRMEGFTPEADRVVPQLGAHNRALLD